MLYIRLSILLILFLSGSTLYLFAETHHIFVDGSYDPGDRHTDMDSLIDKRLQNASNHINQIDPDANRRKVDSKQALLEALNGIECSCGDVINLYFMGHGSHERFIFSKARGRERILQAIELRDALGSAATECCCKINVVIFACHSGSFIEPLFEEEHVRSVYASCGDRELSYTDAFYDENTDFQDQGDWFQGFNEDLRAVRRGTSSGDAIAEATASAKDKMPLNFFDREHPQAWVRDTLSVLAHVESKVIGRGNRRHVEVIIFNPEHLRGQKKRIYLDDHEFPEDLNHCVWIQAHAYFGAPDEDIRFTGDVRLGEKPVIRVLAHVKTRYRNHTEIHTMKPNWLFCDQQSLRRAENVGRGQNVVECRWIEQEVSIHDPFEIDSTSEPIEVTTPTFRIQFHVQDANAGNGEITGRVLSPYWLSYKKIVIRGRERAGLRNLESCTNIWVDITVPEEGYPVGSNVRKVHQDDIRQWDIDIAVERAEVPEQKMITGVVIPRITTVNVGENTMDYRIKVFITPVPDTETDRWSMADTLTAQGKLKQLIPEQINYGQSSGCKCETCPVIYEDEQLLEDVLGAESRESRFKPFQAENGTYKLCAIVIAEGDEVPENDTTSVIFIIQNQEPVIVPDGFQFSAEGTGNTTGHVVTVQVNNRGDLPGSTVLGPYIIPSTKEYQGYVIPFRFPVDLAPGQTAEIEMDGYCIKITSPPVPLGQSTIPIEEWITPHDAGILPDPANSPGEGSGFVPLRTSSPHDPVITYPGTEIVFPYTIDIDKYLQEAAPLIFYAAEALRESLTDRREEGPIVTPISADPDRLNETLIQHGIWVFTAVLDPDESGGYTESDFHDRIIKQMEENTSRDFNQFPDNVQERVETGIQDLWSEIELTGERAKIIKRADE